MADNKQAQLTTAIAAALHEKLAPELSKIAESIAKLHVALSAISARLDILEQTFAAGGTPKKAVRTAAATGIAKVAAAKGEEKAPANSLLFFRKMLADDIDGARATYCSDENLAAVEGVAAVMKAAKVKDNSEKELAAWYSSVGNALWSARLNDDDKKEVKALFEAWKEAQARDASAVPLDAEE